PTEGTDPGPGRPLDLADPHRPHPATTGPQPDRRPTPTLGETSHHTRPADPRPGPPRVSQPPAEDHPSGQRTETLTPRPRRPTRLQERPPRPTTRPRQKHQNRHHAPAEQPTNRLKIKLGELSDGLAAGRSARVGCLLHQADLGHLAVQGIPVSPPPA